MARMTTRSSSSDEEILPSGNAQTLMHSPTEQTGCDQTGGGGCGPCINTERTWTCTLGCKPSRFPPHLSTRPATLWQTNFTSAGSHGHEQSHKVSGAAPLHSSDWSEVTRFCPCVLSTQWPQEDVAAGLGFLVPASCVALFQRWRAVDGTTA